MPTDDRGHGDPPARRRGRVLLRWALPVVAILLWLVVGGPIAGLGSRSSDVQTNDNAAYLPESAESTKVQDLSAEFVGADTLTAIVVYTRASGLTPQDRAAISGQVDRMAAYFGDKLAAPPLGPVFSTRQPSQAAEVALQLVGSDPEKNRSDIDWLRDLVDGGPAGLRAYVTGPAGVLADLLGVFGKINGVLLAVTAGVILLILVIVYRSPFLPLLVLAVAGFALALANGVVYLLARADIVTLSGQTQGILDVLVLGAATDYALLLAARFREELRRHRARFDAMRVAWRAAYEPILASGGTVILGLLCLLVSDLASNRGLGPVGAVGIACALLATLTLLPAVLVLLGRVAFWPFRPWYGSPPAEESGVWPRIAGLVGRRPRLLWITTAVVLLVFAGGMFRLEASGIPQTESFLGSTDSTRGQEVLDRYFPGGTGSPAIVITNEPQLAPVLAAVRELPGVASAVPFTGAPSGPDAANLPVKVIDGRAQVDVTLSPSPDSPAADAVIRDLRTAVHAVPGADALVGGFTATNLDVQDTARRDRQVIIPLVIAVVFLVLMVLLRAVVAPLLLVVTVLLSFFATLGVSGFFFRDVFGFAGADAAYPLFAFVFLVALGVDYNIFLMTRVREEVRRRGNTAGTLAALAVTGGVITSAGVVLAATFAALSVLPLVALVQIAFTVSFGVLLDTLVVRTLLVPALVVDTGPAVWWPSRLRRLSR